MLLGSDGVGDDRDMPDNDRQAVEAPQQLLNFLQLFPTPFPGRGLPPWQ